MKNVLILSSSPHRNGNSDTTCNEFMRKAMKRTIILTAIFLFLANAAKSYAQKDADNFYKNPAIRCIVHNDFQFLAFSGFAHLSKIFIR